MKKKLTIHYAGPINEALESEIEAVVKKYGYTRYASGMSIQDQMRDLAFERCEDEPTD